GIIPIGVRVANATVRPVDAKLALRFFCEGNSGIYGRFLRPMLRRNAVGVLPADGPTVSMRNHMVVLVPFGHCLVPPDLGPFGLILSPILAQVDDDGNEVLKTRPLNDTVCTGGDTMYGRTHRI